MGTTRVVQVALANLVVDAALQPRVSGLDLEHVQALAETPEAWPPLVAVRRGDELVLVDGAHRFAASESLGLESVQVELVEPTELDDLRALAFTLNLRHGRPLTLADRRAEAVRLLQLTPQASSRSIAKGCGLSPNTVERLRRESDQSAQVARTVERGGERAGSYTYAPPRRPGELGPESLGEAVGIGVASLFRGREQAHRKRASSYLRRVAEALTDQFDLGDPDPEALAEAVISQLGEEQVAELAAELGDGASNLLAVARLLGYPADDAGRP